MVRRINFCTKFGVSNQNTSRLVHVKLCAMWCRFVLVRAKRLACHFFGTHCTHNINQLENPSLVITDGIFWATHDTHPHTPIRPRLHAKGHRAMCSNGAD